MAKLEHLVKLFSEMNEAEQEAFVRAYRNKRLLDIDSYVSGSTRKSKSTKSALSFSDEEKDLMKRLGISVKQLSALKSIEQVEVEESDDGDDEQQLFGDF